MRNPLIILSHVSAISYLVCLCCNKLYTQEKTHSQTLTMEVLVCDLSLWMTLENEKLPFYRPKKQNKIYKRKKYIQNSKKKTIVFHNSGCHLLSHLNFHSHRSIFPYPFRKEKNKKLFLDFHQIIIKVFKNRYLLVKFPYIIIFYF